MRAKFILEKFIEDSDPIHDMNIGMIHQIKLWLKSINQPFQDKDNALIYSVMYRKLDFVEYLLAAGADVHTNDDWALQWASENGHTEVVKVLLDASADVHAVDYWALRWASHNGHTEVVKVLKDHIAKEKKIKESLNEKFTEDSDPIHDMGIGIITFENIKPGDIMICKKSSKYFRFNDKTLFRQFGLYIVHKVKKYSSKNLLKLEVIPYGYEYYLVTSPKSEVMSIRNKIINNQKLSVTNFHTNIAPISRWEKYFKILQQKELI
jgi:hypothetical protein